MDDPTDIARSVGAALPASTAASSSPALPAKADSSVRRGRGLRPPARSSDGNAVTDTVDGMRPTVAGPPAPSPLASPEAVIGRLVAGRYRLDALLGQGSVAKVWRATDQDLGTAVALKMLHSHHSADSDARERFQREADAYRRLSSRHVVRVLDFGTDAGELFLVLELVRGRDLKQVLGQRGRLDPMAVAVIVQQVADGLAAAHRVDLTHRDVKPSNVLIARDGWVRLTDFGVAHAVGDSQLTAPEGVVGSARYLAPEQLEGNRGDARSDVYALGVVAWECLTGEQAFLRETPIATALARLSDELPPPRRRRRDIPPELDRAVVAATRRDPRQRPHDGGAFASLFKPVLSAVREADARRLVARLLLGAADTTVTT